MYEEKLKEKLIYDRMALEETFRLLASMLSSSHVHTGSDKSLAALQTVLLELEIKEDNHEQRKDIKKEYDDILRSHGILSRTIKLEGKWWKNATGPFLATDADGDFVALVQGPSGYYRIDSSTGKKIKVNSRTAADLGTDALCFYKELPYRKLTVKDLFKYAWGSIKPGQIVYIIILCIIVVLLGMLVPYSNKLIFSEVIPSGDTSGILPIVSLLLGAGIGAALLGITRNLMLFRAKDQLNANLQAAVMARVYSLPNRFFKENSAGDLCTRALSVNNIYQMITNELLATVAAGIFSVMYILMAFVYAKELVWLVTLIVIIYIIHIAIIYHYYTKKNNEIYPYKSSAQGFVYSLISGIHKIRNNGAEFKALNQWAERFSKSELLTANTPFAIRYQKAFSLLILSCSTTAIYFFSWKSGLSISDYIAFSTAFGVMLSAFDDLHMVMVEISQFFPQLKLISPILEECPENSSATKQVTAISGALEFNNVSYSYTRNIAPVIKNISIRIRAGENVGLVGFSGCGKSTMMRLMMGFEKPSSGSIFYDSYNLDTVNLNSLHKFTGYCPQETHIFPDTIMNNIKISSPLATEEEVWEAARIACIDEDIRRMPAQMQTYLGEGGSGLSGGQCQRIMIARAVLSKPSIMFLDEATSALDNITQKKLVENLSTLKCTRISIAHRLSTIEHCDRILVLDKGEIVEDGTPEELMKKEGYFYRLARRQQI